MNSSCSPSMPRLLANQKGLSLTELMVAVAVSLILMVGLVQLVVVNKTTYNFQQNQTQNFENSRYSFYYIQDFLVRSGFRNKPQDDRSTAFPLLAASAQCAAFEGGQVVANSLEGDGVCIRYERAEDNPNELDCSGAAIADTTAFVTRVFLDADEDRLMCGAQGADAVALVDNIENLVVSYGEKLGNNLAFVASPADWADVNALRVDLLVASDQQVMDTPQSYFFPVSSNTATVATDRRAYRASQRTVSIRNVDL